MVDSIKEKWSRGGAMFHLIFLALSRKYIWAVLVLIGLFVPFVNFLVMIAMFILGGLKGSDWLESDGSLSPEQKNTYITFFDRVGYFLFLAVVVVIVIAIVMALLGGGFLLFHDMIGRRQMFDIPGGDYDMPGGFGMQAGGDIDIIPSVEGQ